MPPAPSADTPASERRARVGLFVLMLVCLLVYLPVLGGQKLDWDDPVWLEDPILSMPLTEALGVALSTARDHVWAPALRMAFWALWEAGGGRTGPVHLAVLGCFLASLPPLYRLAVSLGAPRWLALAALSLWALHPARVESVAWMTGLKDTLSLLFLALAASRLLPEASGGEVSAREQVAGTALGALALVTKPAVFPVPLALAAAVYLRRGRADALRLAPLCAASIAAALLGRVLWEAQPWPEMPRLLLPLWVHGVFVRTTLDPSPAAVVALPDDPLPTALLGILVSGGFLWAAIRRPRVFGPLLLLWWLPQLPFLGLVPMGFFGASRHTLYPQLGLFFALLWASGERIEGRARGLAGVALIGLLLVSSVCSARRALDWRSSRVLWESEVARTDEHWVRWMKVGTARGIDGDFAGADAAFERSLALKADPDTLARKLIAALAKDGWTGEDAALSRRLQPPPEGAAAWMSAVEALRGAGREDLAVYAEQVLRRAD